MKKLAVITFTILFTVSSVFALTAEEQNTIDVYKKVSPGVVTVRNHREQGGVLGAGAVIAKGGYIVTNFHVVADSKKLEVMIGADTIKAAKIIKIDRSADLAIIQVVEDMEASAAKKPTVWVKSNSTNADLTVLPLGSSIALLSGQKVIVIGSPYGLPKSISVGSAQKRYDLPTTAGDFLTITTFIQHDAVTNPGNSGGPIFNSDGEIIGITSFRIASEGAPGVSMGIPVEYVKELLKDIGV